MSTTQIPADVTVCTETEGTIPAGETFAFVGPVSVEVRHGDNASVSGVASMHAEGHPLFLTGPCAFRVLPEVDDFWAKVLS